MAGAFVRAHRLLTEFGIKVLETREFKDAEIDLDGQLILDLRTAKVSARALGRKNRPQMKKDRHG